MTDAEHGNMPFLLPFLEQEALARAYNWNLSWHAPGNQPVVSYQLPVLQCPSAESNRVGDNNPQRQGIYSCSDYAGFREVPQAMVDMGYVSVQTRPDSVLMANAMSRLTDISDGTCQTILYAEDAGRPQL
jgi:hypothetical protein